MSLSKQTIAVIEVALRNNLREAREYNQKYPDGGWSLDDVERSENALSEFLKEKDKLN